MIKKNLHVIFIALFIVFLAVGILSARQPTQSRKSSSLYTYKVLFPAQYDYVSETQYGLIVVRNNTYQYGCYTKDGELCIPVMYDSLTIASDNSLIAAKGEKDGVIDSANCILIPFDYDDIKKEGAVYAARKGDEIFYLNDKNEKTKTDTDFSDESDIITSFDWYFEGNYHSNYIVDESGKELLGIVDKNGLQIVPCEYEHIRPSENRDIFIVTGIDDKEGAVKIVPIEK